MAAANMRKSPYRKDGISVPVALDPSNGTCTRRFCLPILTQQTLFPPLPKRSGKVRTCACGQQWRHYNNVRKTGRLFPEAWDYLAPERVCPTVLGSCIKGWSTIVADLRRCWEPKNLPSEDGRGSDVKVVLFMSAAVQRQMVT